MKRIAAAVAGLVALVAFPAHADWKTGDAPEVEWKGKWYSAKVLEAKDGKLKVHYDGFEDSWDEAVAPSRVRKQ